MDRTGSVCILTCITTLFHNILQTSVILVGAILMGFATLQVRHVQTGPQHWLNAGNRTRCLLMSTVTKKTYIYNMSTMEKNPG